MLCAITAALLAVSALGIARIGWIAVGPESGPQRVVEQVAFLESSLADNSAEQMQALFPEGYAFMHALTALAAVTVTDQTDGPGISRARAHLAQLDSARSTSVFGSGMTPDHGIFLAGWALQVSVSIAEITRDDSDLRDTRTRAEAIEAALTSSPTGFLPSYPGQYWPCDTVVGVSALARAAQLLGEPDWIDSVRSWRALTSNRLDPGTGLFAHRVDAEANPLDEPRGTSQSIIQAFWPDISLALGDPVDTEAWQRFRDAFVVREFGLVGVREYPVGVDGASDVDSGPLLSGVSLSASAVTLAAARRVGDAELARTLDREAELLGFGLTLGGERRYALGQLPVGDAFLAWARSHPQASPLPAGGAPTPLWSALLVVAAVPGLFGTALWWWTRRKQNGAVGGSNLEPPTAPS